MNLPALDRKIKDRRQKAVAQSVHACLTYKSEVNSFILKHKSVIFRVIIISHRESHPLTLD